MDFEFGDTGKGPALLFLPGSYSTQAAWKGIHNSLSQSYRIISTSLPGYGSSKEIRSNAVKDMSQMSDFVADIIDHIGEPVHLIGHSFGGLTAFAAIMSSKASPLSLITFEGNPVFTRPDDGEFPWAGDIIDMKSHFEAAYASGDREAASLIIDFWSRPGVFASMPDAFQDYCRSTAFANILDWRAAAGFTPAVSEFSAIDLPTTIVRGQYAIKPMVDICDEISRTIPGASLKIVDGSGHFLISTHPVDCAAIIDGHMQAFASKQQ